MQIVTPEVTRLEVPSLAVGEGPLWDAASGRLLFVDINAPALYRLGPDGGGLETWLMPARIGSFGLCHDGRALVALETGAHYLDLATGALQLLVHPEPGRSGNRLNDGKTGPGGRFWVGSMDDTGQRRDSAALYRIDPDGRAQLMVDRLTTSNGLAWSADGGTLFHSDSRQAVLWAWAHDPASGTIRDRRELRRFAEEDGRPDGGATDIAGFYWSAGVSAGCLNRIAPDGRIVEKYLLPFPAPTMPCFGGPDLRTLYVTSLSTDRGGEAVAGGLYSLRAPVAGTQVGRFGAG